MIPEGSPRGGREEQADGLDAGHRRGRLLRDQTEPLVQEAMVKNNVGRVYGDGTYDSWANFNFLAKNRIDHAVKVMKNASRKAEVIQRQADLEA